MNAGTLCVDGCCCCCETHTTRTRAHAPPKFKFKFKFKSSPSTLTPTASLESTFDRLPLGCLLFMCVHCNLNLNGPPSTGAAIAMDGGVADTACYYTGR